MLYLLWQALGLTASVTCALTVYTLRSKRDFSFMGAGCLQPHIDCSPTREGLRPHG